MISGRASLMSRFILRMTPMCSSLLSRVYFSSYRMPVLEMYEALYVSRLALESTTIRRRVDLSLALMGWCCSATSAGISGGGQDCDPVRAAAGAESEESSTVLRSQESANC